MRFRGQHDRVYDVQPEPVRLGGQAEVRLAWSGEARFAVKSARLLGGWAPDDWLDREAELVDSLLAGHPDLAAHVVPIVDRGLHEGRRQLVMPWMDHRSDEYVRDKPLGTRLRVARALAASVAALQVRPSGLRHELVHRDIKPSNAFVVHDGGELCVRLADFGAARSRARAHEVTRFLTGAHTEGFAPIDQLLATHDKHLDPSWDVYATAVTVFRLLTDHPVLAVSDSYAQCTVPGRRLLEASAQTTLTADELAAVDELRRRPRAELVHERRLKALLDTDVAILTETVRRGLHDAPLRPPTRQALAADLVDRLQRALEEALAPADRRASDARELVRALGDVIRRFDRGQRGVVELGPGRGRRRAIAVVGAAAVVLGAFVVAPTDAREVAVRIQGAPGLAVDRLALRGPDGQQVLAADGRFGALPVGDWVLEASGDHAGTCPWSRELAVALPRGWGARDLVLDVSDVDCPTARHGYATVGVAGPVDVAMGARPGDPYVSADERPPHTAHLTRGFAIGATEVTQALWTDVMGHDPVLVDRVRTDAGGALPCHTWGDQSLMGDDLPVVCVTWCEALRFANQLSAREGLEPVYRQVDDCEREGRIGWDRSAAGWRLPTEAEWTHAATAGGEHRFVAGSLQHRARYACREATRFGNLKDGPPDGPPPQAWEQDCGGEIPPSDGAVALAPVGQYAPNALGIRDMTGNVREWTFDVYAPYGEAPPSDPAGPAEGAFRTIRGSAFDDGVRHWMLANRMALGRDQRAQMVGVRLVRTLGADPEAPVLWTRSTAVSDIAAANATCGELAGLVPPGVPCRIDAALARAAGGTPWRVTQEGCQVRWSGGTAFVGSAAGWQALGGAGEPWPTGARWLGLTTGEAPAEATHVVVLGSGSRGGYVAPVPGRLTMWPVVPCGGA